MTHAVMMETETRPGEAVGDGGEDLERPVAGELVALRRHPHADELLDGVAVPLPSCLLARQRNAPGGRLLAVAHVEVVGAHAVLVAAVEVFRQQRAGGERGAQERGDGDVVAVITEAIGVHGTSKSGGGVKANRHGMLPTGSGSL